MLRRWSLSQLVAWIGTVGLTVLFLPMGVYLVSSTTSAAHQILAERGAGLCRSVAAQVVTPMLHEDDVTLSAVLQKATRAEREVRYLCLENVQGQVVAHTFGRAYPGELRKLWRRRTSGTVRFRSKAEPLMDIAEPIMSGQLGTLHIGMSRANALAASRRMAWVVVLAFAGALAAVLAGSRIVAARVSHPLRRLARQVSQFPYKVPSNDSIDGSRLAAPAPGQSGTKEVESLAAGFSEMVSRLGALECERAATQARMVHAERLAALGELAAGLAHEIHNPLDGMLECVRHLEADPDKGARATKFYPMLRDGLQRIARVMHEMLDFARSGQNVRVEVSAVSQMVDSVVLLVEANMRERNVRLTRKGAAGCICLCDPTGLAQAGLNLVLNAAEAAETAEDPEVCIEATCDPRWVYISVEDNGPGVPEEAQGRVFEAFFTTKSVGEGTGLGLAVSRELIRASGGDIVLSPEPAKLGGARFVIRLPKASIPENPDDDTAG